MPQIRNILHDVYESIKMDNRRQELLRIVNLEAVPKDSLRRQYVDLSTVVRPMLMGYSLNRYNGKYIHEAKGHTESYGTVLRELVNRYGMEQWQVRDENGANGISIIIVLADLGHNVENIKSDMEHLGWFSAVEPPVQTTIDGLNFVVLQFEPLYQSSIGNIVSNMPTIYHWTPWSNVPSIEKEGFTPRLANGGIFVHPPRVYFIKYGTKMTDMLSLLDDLSASHSGCDMMCMFMVDTARIPKDVEFYLDPRYDDGIFTQQTVPFAAVASRDTWNMKDKRWMGEGFRPDGL